MHLSVILAPLGISATLLVGQAVAQVEPPAPPECPIKTAVENTVIARAWHEDVINRRNPAILQDILASDVVHHAAGGYPKVMDATGIAAMMAEFLTAFPDLRYTFDQFIVQDDYVVERYTAVGTQQGQHGAIPERPVQRSGDSRHAASRCTRRKAEKRRKGRDLWELQGSLG
jgi:predicted ester cyclase